MFKEITMTESGLGYELRNAGYQNQVIIVGFMKPSEKNWFRYLHDWCQIFIQAPTLFLMVDINKCLNILGKHCEEFSFEDFFEGQGNSRFDEYRKKFEEFRMSCGTTPNMIFVPHNSQPSSLVDCLKKEPKFLVIEKRRPF